jgi:hypothetical protein
MKFNRNSTKHPELNLFHMARQTQKMREAGNYRGASFEEERQDFKAYIERTILLGRQKAARLKGDLSR